MGPKRECESRKPDGKGRRTVFVCLNLPGAIAECPEQKQHQQTKDFLKSFDFLVLPFTQNIGHRACVYIEEYALSAGLRAEDAIIAATAAESNLTFITSNAKHFKSIIDLRLKIFKP